MAIKAWLSIPKMLAWKLKQIFSPGKQKNEMAISNEWF